MRTTPLATLRKTALLPALIAAGLFAGCGGGGESAADVATPTDRNVMQADARKSVAAAAQAAPADFEGTLQQVMISLGPDAVRKVVGSTDLETVLAASPDRLIKAVHDGEVEAESILNTTLEIDGRKGRFQQEGDQGYSILDGEQMVTRVVMPEDRTIMTMDPAKMAAAGMAKSQASGPVDMGAEKVGEREIRGFDTTGYRFEFMGNIATAWLSEDLDAQTGAFFDIWSALNPLGPVMDVGEGAPVRSVMVNPESLSGKASFMPAYTITEFYDVQSGDIADDRFALPEGYQQRGMADMGRGAQ